MHVPLATSVTVAPETVQTLVVVNEMLTVNPELAVALTGNAASPSVLSGSAPKVIVWLALATVKLCVTCGAAV